MTGFQIINIKYSALILLLRSQLNAKISLSFKRDFENDQSKLRILVDSRLENQRIWRFVLNSTIISTLPMLAPQPPPFRNIDNIPSNTLQNTPKIRTKEGFRKVGPQ